MTAAALAATFAAAACGRGERGGAERGLPNDSATVVRPPAPGSPAAGAGEVAVAGAAAPLTDANVLALLDRANEEEVESGRVAERRATRAAVRAYARDMVREHAALQGAADSVAERLSIVPQPPLDDASGLQAGATRTALDSASDAAFDGAYLAAQVEAHERTLQLLQRARSATGSDAFRAMVERASSAVEAHLARARALQSP